MASGFPMDPGLLPGHNFTPQIPQMAIGPSSMAYSLGTAFPDGQGETWSPDDVEDDSVDRDHDYGLTPDQDEDDARGGKRAKFDSSRPKATRGSKACIPCRKLKMRCVGAEHGEPCARCIKNGQPHNCNFEPSQRGKKRNQKTEAMQKTVAKMEETLDTVLKSIRTSDPALLAAAAGMIASRPPSDSRPLSNQAMAPLTPLMVPFSTPISMPSSSAAEVPVTAAWTDVAAPEQHQEDAPLSAGTSRPPSPRLHSLPDNSLNPLGLLAEASLSSARGKKDKAYEVDGDENRKPPLGIADPRYFTPGPISILPLRRFVIENRMAPAILSDKVVSPEEVVELFDIYFRFLSPRTCLLVEEIYTPTNTGARSPFLFTCICAVASRYYTKRPELYPELSKRAFNLATEVIIAGYKSVEVIQGFFLLALWSQPTPRYEQDRTWQFTGIALRLATDLNLFRKSTVVLPDSMDQVTKRNYQHEILNRERTWLYCFAVDRSMATLLGKPPTIQEDAIISSAKSWYRQPESSPYDLGLVGMVEMHRLNSRIVDVLYNSTSLSRGLNHDLNYRVLIRNFLQEYISWADDWAERSKIWPAKTIHHEQSRDAMRNFYFRYYSLVFLGCGLQHAVESATPSLDLPTAFSLCLNYATDLVETVVHRMFPLKMLTHSHDSILLMMTYGATFLLKLTKPIGGHRLCDESKCIKLVEQMADCLEQSSVVDSVGPILYSGFLRALLRSRKSTRSLESMSSAARPPTPLDMLPTSMSAVQPINGTTDIDPTLADTSVSLAGSPRMHAQNESQANDPLSQFWDNYLLPGFGGGLLGSTADNEDHAPSFGAPEWSSSVAWPSGFSAQPL